MSDPSVQGTAAGGKALESADAVTATGAVLEIPFVPRLRLEGDFGHSFHVPRPSMGWVRLAYGLTSGDKLHSPDCSRISSVGREEIPPTMALWQIEVDEPCGGCGGPGVRSDPAWVAFRAAADAWEARGRTEPVTWQIQAVMYLLAASARARAAVGEPDRPWRAVVLDALADGMPGAEVWAAYRVANRWARSGEEPSGQERIGATKLACRPLSQLSGVLAPSRRPPVPFPLENASRDGTIPGRRTPRSRGCASGGKTLREPSGSGVSIGRSSGCPERFDRGDVRAIG